jgi:metal-dependent amidase/aminoacylase/carboxypeptidase family protein
LAALALAYKTLSKHPPADKTIYFVFQPSEEGFPSGAKFISQSFIPITKCRAGFAFHVAPSSQLGTITDVRMAAADYFEINVTAKASHIKNKNTHTGGDAILIAAEIVRELNGVQSMENIVNVGTIKGGETPNAIASQTVLTGDIRALNTRQLKSARDYVQKLVSRFPQAQLSLFTGYPVLANDPYLVSLVKQYIPISGVRSTFGTEDFSLYPVPSVFLHIGTGQKAELHSLAFEVPAELVFTIYNYWLSISRIRF